MPDNDKVALEISVVRSQTALRFDGLQYVQCEPGEEHAFYRLNYSARCPRCKRCATIFVNVNASDINDSDTTVGALASAREALERMFGSEHEADRGVMCSPSLSTERGVPRSPAGA